MMHHASGAFSSVITLAKNLQRIRVMLPVLLVMSTLAAGQAGASTFYVDAARPDDLGDGLSWGTAKQTIGAAISASAGGDTILVKYGLYAPGEAILIDSTRLITSDDGTHNSWDSADPDSSMCIVSPSLPTRVFTITGVLVTSATRLRGLQITGGEATSTTPNSKYGGGIYIAGGAKPIIENCWITGNTATTSSYGYGGGIACRDAGTEPVFRYNNIGNNTASSASNGYGGGFHILDVSMCQIHNNTIHDNVASASSGASGGGIYIDDSVVDIWSNTITGNVAAGFSSISGGNGGGIYIYYGTVEIWDNIITYNHGGEGNGRVGRGGGIYLAGGSSGDAFIIRDNPAISFNTGSTRGAGDGGGIYCAGPYVQMYRNTIDGNVATSSNHTTASYRVGKGGGVIMVSFSGNTLVGNIIVNNTASLHGTGSGGGLYYQTVQTIERNIFAFNVASEADEGYGGGCWASSASSAKFANNTFYRNANVITFAATGSGSGLYHSTAGFPAVRNNIFAAHDVPNSDGVGVYSNVVCSIWYSCFQGNSGGDYNANVTSNNEVAADPRLADPYGGDFSLLYDSPCIEEGDPAYDVPENGAWVVDIGAVEYTGTRHRRSVAGAGELLFGGRVKAKVNVTTLGSLSEIDMVVHPGETHPVAPVSVARWYDIDHAGSGMEFDLTLSYLDIELNGRAEDSLVVWRWTGSLWDGPKPYSSRDLDENWITVSGQTNFSAWILTDDWGPTGIGEAPGRFHLSANYPNPFNPMTTITYELAGPSHVRLAVYNAAGQLVDELVNSHKSAGLYHVSWDGLDRGGMQAASGVYFCRMTAGDFTQTRKMVLLR